MNQEGAPMKRTALRVGVCVIGVAVSVWAQEAKSQPPSHVMLPAPDIKWGEPPPVFAKGAQFVVLSGDPGKPGPFAVRLKMPAGYKIAPHWHPTDAHVPVVS